MLNKDQQLLEEAYQQILTEARMTETECTLSLELQMPDLAEEDVVPAIKRVFNNIANNSNGKISFQKNQDIGIDELRYDHDGYSGFVSVRLGVANVAPRKLAEMLKNLFLSIEQKNPKMIFSEITLNDIEDESGNPLTVSLSDHHFDQTSQRKENKKAKGLSAGLQIPTQPTPRGKEQAETARKARALGLDLKNLRRSDDDLMPKY